MSILSLIFILIVWAVYSLANRPRRRPYTKEELERQGQMFCGKSVKECRKILRRDFK